MNRPQLIQEGEMSVPGIDRTVSYLSLKSSWISLSCLYTEDFNDILAECLYFKKEILIPSVKKQQ